MPDITIDSDEYVFRIQIKAKGALLIDAFELSAALADLECEDDVDPTVAQIASCVKETGWTEGNVKIETFSDRELFAVGSKVLTALNKLGNVPERRQMSSQPTASSHDGSVHLKAVS